MSRTTEIDFDKPPVQEVVCGIVFEPIKELATAHLGLLWMNFSQEFPKTEDKRPLLRAEDKEHDLRPRVWYLSDSEEQIIQVQRDRFHFNWRRMNPDTEYPRFDTVYAAFLRHLGTFRDFVDPVGGIQGREYELTYVNLIPMENDALPALSGLLPDFAWRNSQNRYLDPPRAFQYVVEIEVEHQAVLRVGAKSAQARDNPQQRLLQLDLTVRGKIGDTAADEWFDAAHEAIVRGFVDLTDEDAQQDIWKRRR